MQNSTTARVIVHYGKRIEAMLKDGMVLECPIGHRDGNLVVGDYIEVAIDSNNSNTGHVRQRLARRNELIRTQQGSRSKCMAANIDRMLIVSATQPKPRSLDIDRYLIAASVQSIEPMLIFNKIDLLDGKSTLPELVDLYQSLGYSTFPLSAKDPKAMDNLRAELKDATCLLVGASGVGKSSLTNAILDQDVSETAHLSKKSHGKHTTSVARLFIGPHNNALIDAPGIREYGLRHLTARDIIAGYPEFLEPIDNCRFRNCEHQNARYCGLQQAKEKGLINTERLENYLALLAQATLKT